jgi:uncharacterized membrane protein
MDQSNALKPKLRFIRTTLVGGLLFLVPIMVLVMIFEKAVTIAHQVINPLAKHLPFQSILGLQTPVLLAVGLVVLCCFLAGFFARTALARKFVDGLESNVLSNVPGYEFLKRMGESMLGVEKEATYPPVIVSFDDNSQIGFQVETLESGIVVVFIPGVPDVNSGEVYLMSPDRVSPINLPLAATLKCLKRLGAGSGALLRDHAVGGASKQ